MKRFFPAMLLLAGCSDVAFTQLTTIDSFQQNRKNTFDLLLVVDNSCSMAEEQGKLADNFDSFIHYFDGTDVDWQLGVTTTDVYEEPGTGKLIGGDDEIALTNPEFAEQDRVAYSHEWAVSPGMAYALDPSWDSASGNDNVAHWCEVADGTPGAANATCADVTQGSGGNPLISEVIITEFMADPATVADDVGEWVELTNISDADVDLSGWHLVDSGLNSYTFPDGTSISAGSTLVAARSVDASANGGVTAQVELGTDFTLNNDTVILTGTTEGAKEIFTEMVAQGISGSGIEMGLEAARIAVADPDLNAANGFTGTSCEGNASFACPEEGATCQANSEAALECWIPSGNNYGFVREESNLNIFIISDEEDSSPLSLNHYLSSFAEVKGDEAFRDHSIMNVSGVVGSDPPKFEGDSSCTSPNGAATYGHRYVEAVSQTGGLVDSICDDDFSPMVSQLGLTLSGLTAEFPLSHYPDIETLQVAIYDSPDNESKVRDLTLDTDYTYVEDRNSIRFEYEQVPESEQYIVATYSRRSGK